MGRKGSVEEYAVGGVRLKARVELGSGGVKLVGRESSRRMAIHPQAVGRDERERNKGRKMKNKRKKTKKDIMKFHLLIHVTQLREVVVPRSCFDEHFLK